MNYMSNIWKLYAIRFFHNLIPAYVIERLFWEQRGMTIQMVVYTEILYAITVILLEIPTGILADKWGRKRMMIWNAFFGCLEFAILIFAHSFWQFAAAILLAGIGRAMSSGSENALLYDSLRSGGRECHFEKYLGRVNTIDFTAVIIASLYGSILGARFGYVLDYRLSVVSMLISLFASFSLKEPASSEIPEEPVPVREYVRFSIGFFRGNPDVCLVLLAGMVTGACLNFLDEFWQLYVVRLGIPVEYFGVLLSLILLTRLPGNMLSHAVKKRFGYRSLLAVTTGVFSAGFLYLAAFRGFTTLGAILLIGLTSGLIDPLVSGYLHHRITDSAKRATLDSFQSLGLRAALMLTGLGFGAFCGRFDINAGYAFLSALCGVFLIYFLTASKRRVE